MKSLASVAIVFTLLQSSMAYAAWDATADFNATTTNPNGVWSYGYDPAATAGYQLKSFDLFTTAGTLPIAWQDSSYIYSNVPAFEKNTATSRIAGTLPGQIALHPDQSQMTTRPFCVLPPLKLVLTPSARNFWPATWEKRRLG